MSELNEKQMVISALEKGFVSREQIIECQRISINGSEKSIIKVLMQKKYLSPIQVDELCKQQFSSLENTATHNVPVNSNTLTRQTVTENTPDFSRYQLIKELGRGGMGKVYEVYDRERQQHLALKVLLSDATNANEVARFEREAKATARLQHPNIIKVYDIGIEKNQPYFTMDLVKGTSLKDKLKESNLTMKQIAQIMLKITNGMKYAHKEGIIHRDLKPANIMLNDNNIPIIMDFGLAKIENASQKLSRTGAMMGTLQYMPPEQVEGRSSSVDERSDVYGLGAILYEMLTGKSPFTATSYANLINQVINKAPTPPSKIKARVDRDLEKICLKALEKDKNMRYQNAAAFARDLSVFLQGKKVKRHSGGITKNHVTSLIKQNQTVFFVIAIVIFGILSFSMGRSSVENTENTTANISTAFESDNSSSNENSLSSEEKSSIESSTHTEPETTNNISVPENPFDFALWNECWDKEKELFNFSRPDWMALSHEKQFEYSSLYQKWYADKYGLSIEKILNEALPIKLILVPPGIIDNIHNKKTSKIIILRPFYIGKYEITQKEWTTVTKANFSRHQGNENLPLDYVRLIEAERFCNIIKARIPLSDEWIYACHAGVCSQFNIGETITEQQANLFLPSTTVVGNYPFPSAWGGYDFHGNVAEWCSSYNTNKRGEIFFHFCGSPAFSHKRSGDPAKKYKGVVGSFGNLGNGDFLGFRIIVDIK